MMISKDRAERTLATLNGAVSHKQSNGKIRVTWYAKACTDYDTSEYVTVRYTGLIHNNGHLVISERCQVE